MKFHNIVRELREKIYLLLRKIANGFVIILMYLLFQSQKVHKLFLLSSVCVCVVKERVVAIYDNIIHLLVTRSRCMLQLQLSQIK